MTLDMADTSIMLLLFNGALLFVVLVTTAICWFQMRGSITKAASKLAMHREEILALVKTDRDEILALVKADIAARNIVLLDLMTEAKELVGRSEQMATRMSDETAAQTAALGHDSDKRHEAMTEQIEKLAAAAEQVTPPVETPPLTETTVKTDKPGGRVAVDITVEDSLHDKRKK